MGGRQGGRNGSEVKIPSCPLIRPKFCSPHPLQVAHNVQSHQFHSLQGRMKHKCTQACVFTQVHN